LINNLGSPRYEISDRTDLLLGD